jgi:predicted oxidoreductase
LWELVDGSARMTTQRERIRQLQAFVRTHVPAGVSMVDELMQDRRAEAARE